MSMGLRLNCVMLRFKLCLNSQNPALVNNIQFWDALFFSFKKYVSFHSDVKSALSM